MSTSSPSARRSVSFVHASDLHLESPPFGLAEIPEHLRDSLRETPYWAAERVFDLALSEKVDFLVLAGDVLSASETGPRGPTFLCKQFERLREREIAVYWAPGSVDPVEAWPSHFTLPENVHRFTAVKREFTHRRGGLPIAQLFAPAYGTVSPIAIVPSTIVPGPLPRAGTLAPAGMPVIGVCHTEEAEWALAAQGPAHYLALGGRHDAQTIAHDRRVAHFSGSPQGRSPIEHGPHGCTLVAIDHQNAVRHRPVATDLFRWRRETLALAESTSFDELKAACQARLAQVATEHLDVAQLICWTLHGQGPLLRRMARPGGSQELLEQLRADYGYCQPACWSVSLDVAFDTDSLPDVWYEERSLRGDFLRAVRSHQLGTPFDLSAYLPASAALSAEDRAALLQFYDHAKVPVGEEQDSDGTLLHRVAWFGADLLQSHTTQ